MEHFIGSQIWRTKLIQVDFQYKYHEQLKEDECWLNVNRNMMNEQQCT